jgi:hypothetical protein
LLNISNYSKLLDSRSELDKSITCVIIISSHGVDETSLTRESSRKATSLNIQLVGATGIAPVSTAPKAAVLLLDEAPTNSKRGVV